ncbi:MAG TPA: serine/threonine-protein kinase [Polyangia bacterium]|nr:serine/threonine-protein kinase [Polyangia bacterium]
MEVVDCLDEGAVIAFVGGELQGTALQEVERHLVGCPACAALVALAAPATPSRPAGTTQRLDDVSLGRYQLLALLGRGGMGEVYVGYDPELDRKVAIKILRADKADHQGHRARFMREAQAVARLTHPNVVGVYDVGNVGGRMFLAMELVDGETLSAWLARSPRGVSQILHVFAMANRGLDAAHRAGIVHRDFKPQNVMVAGDGSVRVMDFGLAASADPGLPDEPRLTAAGSILGTPHYMSPEQLRGQRADGRADQFSFCVALWEALHGALPFPAKTWGALRAAVLEGRPQAGPLARRVPRRVQAALVRGLSADRDDRFPTMADLLAALNGAGGRTTSRRALATSIASLALAAAVAGLVVARGQAHRAAACDPAPLLTAAWTSLPDDPNRAEARAAFAAAAGEVGDAQARFGKVSALLDQYALRWGGLWRETCDATAASTGDDRVSTLATACLERHGRELAALTHVLVRADARVVRRAVAATTALPAVDSCRDLAALRNTVAPAADPAAQARRDTLTDRLLALRAEAAAGHDAQALEPARALLAEVRAADDAPLLAEGLVITARIQSPFDPDLSVPLYEEAYRIAQNADLSALAGEAAIQLAAIAGAVHHQFVEGERWAGLAEVAVAHAGDARLRGWFLDTRGTIAAARGEWRRARADFEAAVSARETAGAPQELGASLTHLARAAAMLDDGAGALAAASRAVDVQAGLFPSDSYEVGAARLARARALFAVGRGADAGTDLDVARAAFERALGRDHPFLADPMTAAGERALASGDAARARDLLERAWEIRSTQLADGGAREETAFALARAIRAAAGDDAHALELAREASDGYAAFPDLADRRTAVATWISAQADRRRGRR